MTTSTTWIEKRLGDVITLQRGYDITKKEQTEGAYPVVSSSGLNSTHNKFTSPGPGVIIGRKGTLGKAFYVQGPFWAHDTTLWVKDFKGNVPKYVFYLLQSMNLATYDVGASNPTLNRNHLHFLPVVIPDRPGQERIANILSAYDELIEVNQRRTAILEDMARRLFDEWFVRFRYPGHDSTPMVETELGPAPRGWLIQKAGEVIEFDPRTKVAKEGEKIFVPMSALSTTSSVIDGWETRTGNSGAKFQNGDTLFARITPCLENGKTGLVNFLEPGQTAFGSTEFTVMRGRAVSAAFTYLLSRSDDFRACAIKSMGGADGRQRVRPEAIAGFKLALPPNDLMERFTTAIAPMLEAVRTHAEQNTRLRAARNLLLPKLISGEIDLTQARENLAEAAE